MLKVLLTSHGGMAEGMRQSVRMLIGEQERLEVVALQEGEGPDQIEERFAALFDAAAEGDQWLVFCDILGGTPFNVVSKFSFKNDDVAVIYGMNLPMVIEALVLIGSSEPSLQELVQDLQGKAPESIGLSPV